MTLTTNYLVNILGDNAGARMAIRELPLFRTCSDGLLELVFRYGRVFSLAPGEELTREGEFDQWVYFMIDGRLDVYVGGEEVDTIASSLVGERCILGEPRKATLKAAAGGINALGVDMALLDALHDRQQTGNEYEVYYLELLGRITGEIIQRLAELEFNRLNIGRKHSVFLNAERLGELVRKMRENAYEEDPKVNFSVYRHLRAHDPVLLSRSLREDGITVDTRYLYALCLAWGRAELLFQLAERIGQETSNGDLLQLEDDAAQMTEQGFSLFLTRCAEAIRDHHLDIRPAARPLNPSVVKRYFVLNNDLEIDLKGLTGWLAGDFAYSFEEQSGVMMRLLQGASEYTAEANSQLKRMLQKMREIQFIQQVESVQDRPASDISEFYDSTPPEALISFFSKNILEVHLVQPYRERIAELNGAPAGPASSNPDHGPAGKQAEAPESGEVRSLVDDLFD